MLVCIPAVAPQPYLIITSRVSRLCALLFVLGKRIHLSPRLHACNQERFPVEQFFRDALFQLSRTVSLVSKHLFVDVTFASAFIQASLLRVETLCRALWMDHTRT